MEGSKDGRTAVEQDERMVGWKNGITYKKYHRSTKNIH